MTHAFPHVSDNLNHPPNKPADDTDSAPIAADDASHASAETGVTAAAFERNGAQVAPPEEQSEATPGEPDSAHQVSPSADADDTQAGDVQPAGAGAGDNGLTRHDADSGAEQPAEQPVEQPVEKPAAKGGEAETENFWVELRNILALSILLALGIRHFVAEARYIPSESMLPTLEVNDRLIVEKMTYRFREPARGDVVVFKPTDAIRAENPTFNDALIKRIVGLPGETIEVRDGSVFVDGEAIVENYIEEEPAYMWGPQQVPDDSYLVLGDNRNNSYDSHFWGFVPRENLIGRAAVRVWPPGRLGPLDEQPAFYFEVDAEDSVPAPVGE